MISFNSLSNRGRLGNQLFQYAFLRTTALSLGVNFYCPPWIGDEVFLLDDSQERSKTPGDIYETYLEPKHYTGFNKTALSIRDGTNISGYFQTEKYWDRGLVKKWYGFRESKTRRVREKYKATNFANGVGLHIRFGDFVSSPKNRIAYYIPPVNYYMRAFSMVGKREEVMVFSDEIKVAKKYLQSWERDFVFIEDNEPYEDLYLLSQCHDIIISASTFGWWGAFLNEYHDRVVIAPAEGPFRPGPLWFLFNSKYNEYLARNYDYLCNEWITLRALRPFVDSRFNSFIKEFVRHRGVAGLNKRG